MKPESRTLQEQLGSSLNASVLQTEGRRPNVETPLTQVAALGAAGLQIARGADRAGRARDVLPAYAMRGQAMRPQDVLDAELASTLKHLREAGQYDLCRTAVLLFAAHMTFRSRFAALPDRDRLLPLVAQRTIHEWLSDRCPRCGGTGRLEVLANGLLVRGQGRMQRNARFRYCPVHDGCGGTGRPRPSPPARCRALGMSRPRYESERWGAHFNAALAWLEQISRRIHRPLTIQLGRSKKRD